MSDKNLKFEQVQIQFHELSEKELLEINGGSELKSTNIFGNTDYSAHTRENSNQGTIIYKTEEKKEEGYSGGYNPSPETEYTPPPPPPKYYSKIQNDVKLIEANGQIILNLTENDINSIVNENRKYSEKKFSLSQRIENYKNGYGFRTTEQILEYINSEEGKFAIQGINELKTTEWSETITGKNVLKGLEDAYNKGRIYLEELNNKGGYQVFWGDSAYMVIDENAANKYLDGKSKNAIIYLAHEGSHYTYATRNGSFSGWWYEYEVEGYRISDSLSLELIGKSFDGSETIRTVIDIENYLNDKNYKWIPSYEYVTGKEFQYWNKDDIGQ